MDAIAAVIYHNTFGYMNTSMDKKFGLSPIQFAKLEDKIKIEVENKLLFS